MACCKVGIPFVLPEIEITLFSHASQSAQPFPPILTMAKSFPSSSAFLIKFCRDFTFYSSRSAFVYFFFWDKRKRCLQIHISSSPHIFLSYGKTRLHLGHSIIKTEVFFANILFFLILNIRMSVTTKNKMIKIVINASTISIYNHATEKARIFY